MLRFVHFRVFKHQIQTMYMWLVSFIDNRSSGSFLFVTEFVSGILTFTHQVNCWDQRKRGNHKTTARYTSVQTITQVNKRDLQSSSITVLTDSQEPGYTNTDIFFKLKSYYSDLLDRLRYKLKSSLRWMHTVHQPYLSADTNMTGVGGNQAAQS